MNSEINTLGYPRAALFAFCVALVAYIIMAILKAALRSVHGTKTIEDDFSGYYLADELSGVYQGMMISIPSQEWNDLSRANRITTNPMPSNARGECKIIALSETPSGSEKATLQNE